MNDQPANQANEGQDAAVELSLYAKREKIYAREVHGIYARLRVLAVLVLLGAYYGVPWLTWHGRQAVLLDLPNRQFRLFGITFWPQDFFYLAALLIIAALSLFFFTALAGRLWCGYACPQTVWTEVFMWIERKIEGDRPKQMKLDKMPLSARKFAIKGGKHAAWILFSLYTGFTFVGYFTPIHDLAARVVTLGLGPWETFWILFYSFATYGNAGWMREQVCIYMCPYARFQSAMFDKDTLIISYDDDRGEPRGGRKRSVNPAEVGLGDCIDCSLCVQVCPTGIDIRDGLQFECIGCAACVDVCDEVMDKMGYPKGLVRYTTEHSVHGEKTHVLRPRMFVYATLLLVLAGALVVSIAGRVPLEVDVIRDRRALYKETNEGLIANTYNIKVVNKDQIPHRYRLSASGLEGLELINTMGEFAVESGRVLEVPVRLSIDPVNIDRASSKVEFEVVALDNPDIVHVESARFLGPVLK